MADGKWTMTDDDARRVDLSFSGYANKNMRNLPNYGQHRYVDNRNGNAQLNCAFCGSHELEAGFGGYGDGFGYKSYRCSKCGGITDAVYKDEKGCLLDTCLDG